MLSLILEIESLVLLNLSTKESIPKNPEPTQKTHPLDSVSLNLIKICISQGSTTETEPVGGM